MLIKDILQSKHALDKVAITFGRHQRTYAELHQDAERLTGAIRDLIENPGNHIGIFLPNSLQYAQAYFAIQYADKTAVPINASAKAPEVISTVEYCELRVVITNTTGLETLREFWPESNLRLFVFNLDNESYSQLGTGLELVELTKSVNGEDEDDVAVMLHTSGTTSSPKRVMLTHANLLANIRSNIKSLGLTENDKVLVALPMFFGYCHTAQFLTHLYLGASVVIAKHMFLPKNFFASVAEHKITNFTGVPSMLLTWLNYRYTAEYDMNSLRYVCFGGGNMPLDKLQQLMELLPNTNFVQTYGQTEASPRATALLPKDALRKLGSVGQPIPDVEVRVVDDEGQELPQNTVGNIVIRGKNVMKGYYKRPEITATTIKDGWLYTGDLGKFDDEGYLYLVGRKKNMIISGGQNIYPEEIEEIMLNHPAVRELRVLGEADDSMGEKIVASIVLVEGQQATAKELMEFAASRLASCKVPAEMKIIESLPKTATGKVRRY